MKNLIFRELLVISETEKAARAIKFHPLMTVIQGENDTGKSSIVKSIYHALGAEPHNILDRWKNARTVSALNFVLDGTDYWLLRDDDSFTLFDHRKTVVRTFKSVTKELGPYFAKMFNFKILLSRSGEAPASQATPAFLFLPFYFDQDSSWTDNWAGFRQLQQFTNWRTDVALFHTGVRPAEYYAAKIERAEASQHLETAESERATVRTIRRRLEKDLPVAQFDVDLNAFRREVDELISESAELRAVEQKMRNRLVKLHTERETLLQEQAIAEVAMKELSSDFRFAADLPDSVECPTCGTTHTNNFLERFKIARDEEQCHELLASVRAHLEAVDSEIQATTQRMGEALARAERVSEILNRKRGDLTLHDIVRAEGKRELRTIVDADLTAIETRSASLRATAEDAVQRMSTFDSKKRRHEIVAFYLDRMREYLPALNVSGLSEKSFKKLDSRIKESGSDFPRALLAYYFSILHTIFKYSTSTFCPVVIDSPRQQDQDDSNWQAILEFIRDNRPPNTQTILALVDSGQVDLPGSRIVFSEKHHVLQKSEYARVSREVRFLRDASHEMKSKRAK